MGLAIGSIILDATSEVWGGKQGRNRCPADGSGCKLRLCAVSGHGFSSKQKGRNLRVVIATSTAQLSGYLPVAAEERSHSWSSAPLGLLHTWQETVQLYSLNAGSRGLSDSPMSLRRTAVGPYQPPAEYTRTRSSTSFETLLFLNHTLASE